MNPPETLQKKTRAVKTSQELMALLIVTVALVLLALIFASSQVGLIVALAVIVILIVLILAVCGSPELLPDTLKATLSELRRLLRPQ